VLFPLFAGLTALAVGAELLVRGASALALRFGLPPLLIGLTVVAFGTSAPELAVSLVGVLGGQSGIALGNAVGSNTFNVLAILGLSALITPLAVQRDLIARDIPVMIGVSLTAWLVGIDGNVSRAEGLVLVAGLIVYTSWLFLAARSEKDGGDSENSAVSPIAAAALVVAGLGLLVGGSQAFVDASVALARARGWSELAIGLTIVAAGTSLPELSTSVASALKGERDIAIGNVVGSNVFNILGVLGMSATVAGNGIEVTAAALGVDLPVMILAALVCFPLSLTGRRISRGEGALLLLAYLAYVGFSLGLFG
jgi:cation:H+ antiporter